MPLSLPVGVGLTIHRHCHTWVAIDDDHNVTASALDNDLVLHLLTQADDAIGDRGLLACQLEVLRVFSLVLLHHLLELLRLADHLLARVVGVELRKHGFPGLGHLVPLHPQLLHAEQVAGVVLYEVQELLTHQLIAVALQDSRLHHTCDVCERVLCLAATALGFLQRGREGAVAVTEVAICFVAGRLIEASQRDVVPVHVAYVLQRLSTHKPSFVLL